MEESRENGKSGEFCAMFMAKMEKVVADSLGTIENTWNNMGISYEERCRRTELFAQTAKSMLEKAVKSQDDEYNELIANIEHLGKQVLRLADELKLKSKEPSEHFTTLQLEEFLAAYLEELKLEKMNRMNTFDSLKTEREKLESFLGFTPISFCPDGTPTGTQLEELRTRIKELRKEKDRRFCTFSALKGIIVRLWRSMEEKPQTEFEVAVASANEKTFPLTPASLDAMRSLKDKLESDLQDRTFEAEKLREQIIRLWNLLHIPVEEKDDFLANNMGYSRSVIKVLTEELDQLERTKAENIKTLIARLREEVLMYWDKCLFSKSQKESVQCYYSEDCTEEALDELEIYLKSLKDLHEECHACFEKVSRLNSLFEKQISFVTKKDLSGDRFYNRGGALLKEEKERRKVQALIPKLIAEVQESVAVWESEHQARFSVYGKSFGDYIQEQWETYEREKENERLERYIKKTQNLECPGSTSMACKRPLSQLGTPMSTRASKVSRINTPMSFSRMTPMSRVCTRSVLRSQNQNNTPLGKPPLSTSKMFATQPKKKVVPRRLHQRVAPAAQRKLLNSSKVDPYFNPFVARELKDSALMPTADISSYSNFQSKLAPFNGKPELSSTLVHPSGPSTSRRPEAS